MKEPIVYIDRKTKELQEEQVYGEKALRFLYERNFLSKTVNFLTVKFALFSHLYGLWQKGPWTKKNILPFVNKYNIDKSEFLQEVTSFSSFNDFFCRKLKKESRPVHAEEKGAVIPADGRFLFYPKIHSADGFIVKGKKFTLFELLQDNELAKRYEEGSLVIGRLCPTDYHRFHFPFDCTPSKPRLINGHYYSVNPIALRKNLRYLCENKRVVTELQTTSFGKVQYIEVGATGVGTIHQSFTPLKPYHKGDEKGYFSFGGSCLILLFEPSCIVFDDDLLIASSYHREILCQMGQSMGKSTSC